MAFNIPTIRDLYSQIYNDLLSKLGVTLPIFGKAYLSAEALVQAGKLHLFYRSLALVQKNLGPDIAEPELKGGTLERYGRVKLGRDPFPATNGIYLVEITGTIGSAIKSGQTFKSDDTSLNPGGLYVLDVEKILVFETDTITLRSLEVGLGIKLNPGDTLTSTSPIIGVDKSASVVSETTSPIAEENIEDYRTAILQSYRLEAQGGSYADYILWALDAQGVLRVYPFNKSGTVNEINVYIESSTESSIDGKGTPSQTILDNVEEVIEFDPDDTLELFERARRPANDKPNVLAVSPISVDITYFDFIGGSLEIQATIEQALGDYLFNVRPFVAGADIIENKKDVITPSKIIFATQSAIPDSVFFSGVELKINNVVINTSYTFINGFIPFLNNVSYL